MSRIADAQHGKGSKKAKKGDKGKFRETLWFKKGELDAAAAEAAEAEKRRSGRDAMDKADSMPMEERYDDDGTLTAGDEQKFSLKTGATQTMPAFRDQPAGRRSEISERELVDEMRSGRGKIIAAIVLGVVLLGAIIAYAVAGSGGHPPAESERDERAAPIE